MEVYLDNSATTKPYIEVTEVVCDTMNNLYANPSSLHRFGKLAEDEVEKARKKVASYIGASADEIYFTSGGTEGDNMGILGYVSANFRPGKNVVTTAVEHPAVSECFKLLESRGVTVKYIGTDAYGNIDYDELEREIDENTILFTGILVNNEVGSILDVEKVASIINDKTNGCALMVDGVQAFGKVDIDVKRQNIDMLSVSSHKIHGPNGVGALYVSKNIRIKNVIFGGGQEKGLRSGTENVAGILGFEKACEITFNNKAEDIKRVSELKCKLKEGLLNIDGAVVNSPDDGVCNILNVSFVGVKSEVLLHVLESKGIYVSSGSACSSHKKKHSHVLTAMGLNDKRRDSAIRFSLSAMNTIEEIEYTVEVLKKEVPILKKIMR